MLRDAIELYCSHFKSDENDPIDTADTLTDADCLD